MIREFAKKLASKLGKLLLGETHNVSSKSRKDAFEEIVVGGVEVATSFGLLGPAAKIWLSCVSASDKVIKKFKDYNTRTINNPPPQQKTSKTDFCEMLPAKIFTSTIPDKYKRDFENFYGKIYTKTLEVTKNIDEIIQNPTSPSCVTEQLTKITHSAREVSTEFATQTLLMTQSIYHPGLLIPETATNDPKLQELLIQSQGGAKEMQNHLIDTMNPLGLAEKTVQLFHNAASLAEDQISAINSPRSSINRKKPSERANKFLDGVSNDFSDVGNELEGLYKNCKTTFESGLGFFSNLINVSGNKEKSQNQSR